VGVLDQLAIVVTGSGRGLGRAYARAAAREGALMVVNDIDGQEADKVVAEIQKEGGQAISSHQSVAEPDSAKELIALCLEAFGRIDGLVNDAALLVSCEPWGVNIAPNAGVLAGFKGGHRR
jgi:NAD(P)-dependent dehydrogenase (short-subunit alcohol dehydrogenase family)